MMDLNSTVVTDTTLTVVRNTIIALVELCREGTLAHQRKRGSAKMPKLA